MFGKTKYFAVILFVVILLSGCNTNEVKNDQEDLFSYKDSYVGDNAAVGHITKALPSPGGESVSSLELKTKEEPYGVIVKYKDVALTGTIEKNYKETALYNATFLFTLVHNAEWVQFNFVEESVKVNRDELQEWYGKNLSGFESEDEVTALIQNQLKNESNLHDYFK
ncbi:DUF4825 domain-containing protein [Bacillus sp. BGMRC 2118]|nr:DUF4825 domain-containing protein [Bacillus sp. BGMRC 2118]